MSPIDVPVHELRRLAAEVREDLAEVQRVVDEARSACSALASRPPSTLEVYGAGKLVHDFYTGIERTLVRIAGLLGGIPSGPAWHRTLLEDAALDIKDVRPAVLRRETRAALDQYLRFRHLFRNLYAFTLREGDVTALLASVGTVSARVREDLEAFLAFLDGLGREG